MIGLERGNVALCPHDPEWGAEARRTMDKLRLILGDAAVDIAHVGSTAVNAIAAKPIIDIAVATDDFESILNKNGELEKNGFYYRYEIDASGERVRREAGPANAGIAQLLYACGGLYDGSNSLQTHFIHVVKADSAEWHDYINFRDRLNADETIAKEYEKLKMALSQKYADDRKEYTARKNDFIRHILNPF